MPGITNYYEGFRRTNDAIKLLLGLIPGTDRPFTDYTQFGYHGYNISLFESHVQYLSDVNSIITAALPEFNGNVVGRWKLVNMLLLDQFSGVHFIRGPLTTELPDIAALAAFPVLEEVARLISNAWDEEGTLLREVPEAEGISTWNSDGSRRVRKYRSGELIVSLSHKLQLMHKSLYPNIHATVDSLDRVFQRPLIQGLEQPMSPLYDRLAFWRNQWMHGRRYEGWEALLVSLLLALLYFGQLGQREQEQN